MKQFFFSNLHLCAITRDLRTCSHYIAITQTRWVLKEPFYLMFVVEIRLYISVNNGALKGIITVFRSHVIGIFPIVYLFLSRNFPSSPSSLFLTSALVSGDVSDSCTCVYNINICNIEMIIALINQ